MDPKKNRIDRVPCPASETCMDYGSGRVECAIFEPNEYRTDQTSICRIGNIAKVTRFTRKDDAQSIHYGPTLRVVEKCRPTAPCTEFSGGGAVCLDPDVYRTVDVARCEGDSIMKQSEYKHRGNDSIVGLGPQVLDEKCSPGACRDSKGEGRNHISKGSKGSSIYGSSRDSEEFREVFCDKSPPHSPLPPPAARPSAPPQSVEFEYRWDFTERCVDGDIMNVTRLTHKSDGMIVHYGPPIGIIKKCHPNARCMPISGAWCPPPPTTPNISWLNLSPPNTPELTPLRAHVPDAPASAFPARAPAPASPDHAQNSPAHSPAQSDPPRDRNSSQPQRKLQKLRKGS